ncbi:MAG: hypothetical protein ACRCS6_09780 [Turicibacter sp.]
MNYTDILERVEMGKLSVDQAEKEIKKLAERKMKARGKKLYIEIEAQGKKFKFFGVHLNLLSGLLELSKPFLGIRFELDCDTANEEIDIKIEKEQLKSMVSFIQYVLKDFKCYPPKTFISINLKDIKVQVETR